MITKNPKKCRETGFLVKKHLKKVKKYKNPVSGALLTKNPAKGPYGPFGSQRPNTFFGFLAKKGHP